MLKDLVSATMDRIRRTFDPIDDLMPQAVALLTDGGEAHIAMPAMSDVQQRQTLKEMLPEMGAVAVVVAHEAWRSPPKTPEELELSARLHAEGRLQEAPASIRSEVIILFGETPDGGIVRYSATVLRDQDGRRSLAEWEQDVITLPYPWFRRYFPNATPTH